MTGRDPSSVARTQIVYELLVSKSNETADSRLAPKIENERLSAKGPPTQVSTRLKLWVCPASGSVAVKPPTSGAGRLFSSMLLGDNEMSVGLLASAVVNEKT